MPDHPSWPAELVEKATAAVRRTWHMNEHASADETAAAVLSALSGDLVYWPVTSSAASPVELVPRSQADALAEALETYAEQIERDRREPDKMLCVVLSMRRSAASYRSSSSEAGA